MFTKSNTVFKYTPLYNMSLYFYVWYLSIYLAVYVWVIFKDYVIKVKKCPIQTKTLASLIIDTISAVKIRKAIKNMSLATIYFKITVH